MWLWASVTGAGEPEITVLWQAFLRRFDLEHTFRFFKQVLGWDAPLLRDPAAAGPLDLAHHRLLRPAPPRSRPRHGPPPALAAAPAARHDDPRAGPAGIPPRRNTVSTPAAPPKPGKPGPGRPKGSRNQHKAPSCDVGKRHTEDRKRTKRRAKTKQAG